jgi:hypothetical protein
MYSISMLVADEMLIQIHDVMFTHLGNELGLLPSIFACKYGLASCEMKGDTAETPDFAGLGVRLTTQDKLWGHIPQHLL